ncbi:MAG: hypothetical protein RBU37_11950 [Myxococcota bacterium]|nr:hypothetical protein [Myxococcota bacterium]
MSVSKLVLLLLCCLLSAGSLSCSKEEASQGEEAEKPAANPAEAAPEPERSVPAPAGVTPAGRAPSRADRKAAHDARTQGGARPSPRTPAEAPEVELAAPLEAQWLEKSELRQVLEYKGLLELDTIHGQRGTGYQAERFKTEQASQFGIGLQVYKGGNPAKRYDDLLAQSWGGSISKDVGDLSFRSEHHRLRELTFLDRKRTLVAILSCDVELCSFDQLVELGRRVQLRL